MSYSSRITFSLKFSFSCKLQFICPNTIVVHVCILKIGKQPQKNTDGFSKSFWRRSKDDERRRLIFYTWVWDCTIFDVFSNLNLDKNRNVDPHRSQINPPNSHGTIDFFHSFRAWVFWDSHRILWIWIIVWLMFSIYTR